MSNRQLIEELVNAFGSPNFDQDIAASQLRRTIEQVQAEGGNAGSLLTIVNMLRTIDTECKKRYNK